MLWQLSIRYTPFAYRGLRGGQTWEAQPNVPVEGDRLGEVTQNPGRNWGLRVACPCET